MRKLLKKDRGFYWSSKAFYSNGKNKEIIFGLYPNNGNEGTYGEMAMRWINLSGNNTLSPQLRVFDDAFAVLATFTDLIQELKKLDSTNFTEEQFVAVLKKCGFKDLTEYSND